MNGCISKKFNLNTVYLIIKVDLGRVFYFQGINENAEMEARFIWTEHLEQAECFELEIAFEGCEYYGGLAVQKIEL